MTAKRMTEGKLITIAGYYGPCPVQSDGDCDTQCGHDDEECYSNALIQECERARESEKRLVEALESVLQPNKDDGVLHAHDCIGLHGYGCKPWCADLRAALQAASGEET